MFICGGDRLTDGATLGGGAATAVEGGFAVANGGAYVRVVVVGAATGDSTTVADGVGGSTTATGGGAGGEVAIGGAAAGADVAVGGFFSSGAYAGPPRGYQTVRPTMTAVARTTAVITSP
jgi:hypothetical protein